MTGHMPQASVATILAATTAEGQCASEALLQTWHRLRLAVLHSIWAASQVTQHASATLFFFFFFFWVTGEMFILYRQSTDRDTELT